MGTAAPAPHHVRLSSSPCRAYRGLLGVARLRSPLSRRSARGAPSHDRRFASTACRSGPELALTSAQHQRGLMFRRKAPEDGMLFVFARATTGGFWMKNTLVPLTIVFFDSKGKRVRKLSMTPCRKDPAGSTTRASSTASRSSCRASDTRPALRHRPSRRARAPDPRRGLTVRALCLALSRLARRAAGGRRAAATRGRARSRATTSARTPPPSRSARARRRGRSRTAAGRAASSPGCARQTSTCVSRCACGRSSNGPGSGSS